MPHATVKKGKNGKLILEFEVVMRIPVEFDGMQRDVISDIYMTPREKQVFDGLVKGRSNQEISDIMHVSVWTVKFHVSSILGKFHVRGRHELGALVLSQEMQKEKL